MPAPVATTEHGFPAAAPQRSFRHARGLRSPWAPLLAAVLGGAVCSSDALAAAPAPNPALDQVLGQLRGTLEAATADGTSQIKAETGSALSGFLRRADDEIAAGLPQHRQAIRAISASAEAGLATTKQQFKAARAEAAIRARLTARTEAAAVQKEAEDEIAGLEKKAALLEAEGGGKLTEANNALATLQQAVVQVQQWRQQWPRDSINNAIKLGSQSQQAAPQMEDTAEEADKVDVQLDQRAMTVLQEIRSTMKHAQNAALIARSALDQAEQNAIKLKHIRELVNGASTAVDAAQERKIDAAAAAR